MSVIRLGLVSLAAGISAASLGQITIQNTWDPGNSAPSLDSGGNWTGSDSWAGLLKWQTTPNASQAAGLGFVVNAQSYFFTVCSSFNQEFSEGGSFQVTPISLAGGGPVNLASLLPTNDVGETAANFLHAAAIFQNFEPGVFASADPNAAAAGLQLAVWHTEFGGATLLPSFANGSSDVALAYATDMAYAGTDTSRVVWLDYAGASDSGHVNGQGQFVLTNPVPEPFTMGFAFAGLGLAVRRKLRSAS